MLLVFEIVFPVPVISQINFIGGGWVGEGWDGRWGWVGSQRHVKVPIQTQTEGLCLQYVTDNPIGSSLVPHAVLLMLSRTMKCTLVV